MKLKMVHKNLVLLPGLDGTGRMFEPLIRKLHAPYRAVVVSYPTDRPLSYHQLVPYIRDAVPWDEPFLLVAESFAGPLALEFAAVQWECVEGVVLSASFIANPLHPWINLARSILGTTEFKKPPPEMFLKKLLLGQDTPESLVASLKDCLDSVRPDVLTHRLNMVTQVNASRFLRECKAPVLYLLGKHDQLVADRGWKAIEQIRPDAACIEIDAPHLIFQTQPEAALKAIEAFIGQLEGSREELFKTTADPWVLSS